MRRSPSGASAGRRGLGTEVALDFRGDFLELVSFRMSQVLVLVLRAQVSEEDQVMAKQEMVDDSHATTLRAAGAAPSCLPKATRAANERMAPRLRGDRFLHLQQHRRPQQAGGGPLIAAASDDASHEIIIRLCRMKRQGCAALEGSGHAIRSQECPNSWRSGLHWDFRGVWWTWSGSNRRPLPCHGSALPTAPQAQP